MTFTSTSITKAEGNTYNVNGTLTIKGVSSDLVLPLTYGGRKDHALAPGMEVIGFNGNLTMLGGRGDGGGASRGGNDFGGDSYGGGGYDGGYGSPAPSRGGSSGGASRGGSAPSGGFSRDLDDDIPF